MRARSLLFVPATSEKKIAKAFASAADELIVDLEDAVADDEKPAARRVLPAIVAQPHTQPLWVRANAFTTRHCYLDLVAIVAARPDGVLLPKVQSAEEVRAVDWLLSQLEHCAGLPDRGIALMCIVENAAGLVNASAIAAACPRTRRLMFGAVDLGNDMNLDISDEGGATDVARFEVAKASRAGGLEGPMDTAYLDVKNPAGLEATARRARGLGFAGKVCIHPDQIAVVNRVFSPGEAEIAFARRVVAEFAIAEGEGKGALLVDGIMVDYPVVYRAQRLLDSL